MSTSWRTLDLREFGDWPLAWRALACALSALLVLAMLWILSTRQAVRERQVLIASGQALQVQLMTARQQLADYPASSTEYISAGPPVHLPTLMIALHALASSAGLRDGQFRPGASIGATAGTQAQPPALELHLVGTWAQLVHFAQALAELNAEAIAGMEEIGLRAEASTSRLELTARVRIYPRPAYATTSQLPITSQPHAEISARNPFAQARIRAHQASGHTLIGSIRSGHGQAGLAIGEDGQLRRVTPGPRHRQRSEP